MILTINLISRMVLFNLIQFYSGEIIVFKLKAELKRVAKIKNSGTAKKILDDATETAIEQLVASGLVEQQIYTLLPDLKNVQTMIYRSRRSIIPKQVDTLTIHSHESSSYPEIKLTDPNIHRFIQSIGDKHTSFYKKFLKLSGGHRKSKDKKRDEDFNALYRESIRMYEDSGETFTAASQLLENITINSIVSNPVTHDNEPDEIAEVEDEIVTDDVIPEAEVIPDE